MGKLLLAENGKVRDANNIILAEEVFKKKKDGDHWGAIDLLLKAWSEIAEDEVQALEVQIESYRETLEDPKFGQTKGGKQLERRFTLAFPQRLMMMIRSIYKADELQFDREFFKEFAKRYPYFKVAEKS